MSDFEMLYLMFTVLGVVVSLVIELIRNLKK